MLDWRNPDDYEFPEDFSVIRWAWEFLRRNPKYRQDWQATLGRYLAKEGEFMSTQQTIDLIMSGKAAEIPIPELVHVPDDDYAPDHPSFAISSHRALEDWCLSYGYLNPDQDAPALLHFRDPEGNVITNRPKTEQSPSLVWARFNLRRPIKPQLEGVSKTLLEVQAALKASFGGIRRPKGHRALWPLYLRLLDARNDGAQQKKVAEHLSRERADAIDEKEISDQTRAALRLTKPAGYLDIIF